MGGMLCLISQALPALITHPPVIVITLVAAFAAEAAPLAAARLGWRVLGAPRAWDTGYLMELGYCSATCLASAGVSPMGWQCPCLAGDGRMQDFLLQVLQK